jgi:hypothetical protein
VRRLIVLALVALPLVLGGAASGDDDPWRFRRTTPRASLTVAAGAYAIGLPGGRAWGIESALRRVPRRPTTITVELAVRDPSVREAFVRVAYYASAGRSRQIALADSELVPFGERRFVEIALDAPEDAIAYRVRVLARLAVPADSSGEAAVEAGHVALRPAAVGPSATRLRATDAPGLR